MNKDSGFTLVELLAVVMVIGLVALVSVPIVRNITKDAKQKGKERQIGIVLESAKNWAVKNTNLLPEDNNPILVKMDTLKKEGLLENKKVINPVNNKEMNGCAKIIYDADFNQYKYEYVDDCTSGPGLLAQLATTSTDLEVDSVADCVTEGTTCEAGTAFAIQVNDEDIYKFRVLKDEDNVVTLIMSGNIYEEGIPDPNVAWNISGNFADGPITALAALKARTSGWDNLETYSYILDYGKGTYSGEYVQNVRARLPKLSDITTEAIGCAKDDITCPDWIYEVLYDSGDKNTCGYWLSDIAIDMAYIVFYEDGFIIDISVDGTDDFYSDIGIRPVIEISKTAITY